MVSGQIPSVRCADMLAFLQTLFGGAPWVNALQKRNFAAIADWFTTCFFAAGIIGLLLAGIAAGLGERNFNSGVWVGFRVLALGVLFAAACTASGWLLGLLFGIPRTLARTNVQQTPNGSGENKSTPPEDNASSASRVNTNLEDISDWLTKTIVGVGLTQLTATPHFIWHVADQFNQHGFKWD